MLNARLIDGAQRQASRRLAVFRVFCWDFPVTMIIVTAVFGVLRPFLQ